MSRSQAPPPDRGRPSRGEISLGDAVTAAGRLGADPEAMTYILDALDLVVGVVKPVQVPEPPPSEPDDGDDWDIDDAELEQPVEEAAAPAEPVGATVTFTDDDPGRPPWMTNVDAIAFGPLTAEVAVPPPLPAAQARAAMVVAAATRRPGRKLDVERLVERAARAEPLAPAPLLAELRTADSIQLLIDAGEAMEPYAADVAFLEEWFLDVAGADRIELHTFVGTPLRGVDRDPFTERAARWVRPPPRSLVVVVSELGIGGPRWGRGRAGAAEWNRLAAEVGECGAWLRVLTPFGADRWPAGLADAAYVTNWESLADLVEHRA